jgi:hypothetical protein
MKVSGRSSRKSAVRECGKITEEQSDFGTVFLLTLNVICDIIPTNNELKNQ